MKCILFLAVFLFPLPLYAQVGHWEGTMIREGSELNASFDFTKEDTAWSGFFNAPTMRALKVPLSNVRFDRGNAHFELVGDQTTTVFEGKWNHDSMNGVFQDGIAHGTFQLKNVPARIPRFAEEQITFQNGDVTLAGTLLIPHTSGIYPAVVFQHGSGPEGRYGGRFLAENCAEHGIAALIYDKRGVGKSTGDWKKANFQDLANDTISGIHLLQKRREINPGRIGIYGHSQGGFIGPLIASLTKDVAFVISADSAAGPTYEQDLFRVKNALEQTEFTKEEQQAAFRYYSLFIEAMQTGQISESFEIATQKARSEKWFEWLDIPPKDHWLWSFYKGIAHYDSIPYWEKVTVPVLLIYGERDRLVPVKESISKIELALNKAHNHNYSVIIFPDAQHNLNVESPSGQPFDWPHHAPGFPESVVGWILYQSASSEN